MCTGRNEVIAIDAESGRSLWRYDARPDATGVPVATCRGVAYSKVPDAAGLCAERIITATTEDSLLALDQVKGRAYPGSGPQGRAAPPRCSGAGDQGESFGTRVPH